MPVTTTDDIAIHFEVTGEAGAPLVLIGGGATHLIDWREEFVAMLVAEGFQVIRYDHRDIGLSPRFGGPDDVDGGYDLDDLADDVLRILDTLGIASAHLAGHSMGGIIAQYLALDHPDRVRSMVLMSTIPGLDRDAYLTGPQVTHADLVPFPALPPELALDQFVATQRGMHAEAFVFDEEDERAHAARQIARGYDPNGFQRHMSALLRATDRLPRLRTLTLPTAVIHGSDDPGLKPRAAELIAEAIPGATLHIHEGMGHRIERALWPDHVAVIAATARRADG